MIQYFGRYKIIKEIGHGSMGIVKPVPGGD